MTIELITGPVGNSSEPLPTVAKVVASKSGYRNPPILAFFSDFDGTITDEDSNDFMIDNFGMGRPARRELLLKCLHEGLTFREAFRAMIDSVAQNKSFSECCELVRAANIKLDPGFKDFYLYLKSKGIPLVILSSGMSPIIRIIISNLIGDEEADRLTIIANDVDLRGGDGSPGTWGVQFRHPDSPFGHNKDVAISEFRQENPGYTIFFSGDGISDLSASRSATLFVKMREGSGDDLAAHCEKENIPFEGFRSFREVQLGVDAVFGGTLTLDKLCTGRNGHAEWY
ncbi:hypothetical protein MD484_g1908, partial [Candolleomyces efflorescens]